MNEADDSNAYVALSSLLGVDTRTPKERMQADVIASLRREVAELEARLAGGKTNGN